MTVRRVERARRFLGLDAHVLPTLIFRGWSIVAGAVMVLGIPFWLGRVEQGYYFTFASLVALQVFFELGMNQVIVQLVSHDHAHIDAARTGAVSEASVVERSKAHLAALVRLLRRWYAVAATLLLVVVSACGIVFFSRKGGLPPGEWLGPWLLLVLATAFNLYFSAMLTVFEGCGQLGQVARMRLWQSMIGYVCLWAALSSGASLWAVPLMPASAAVFTFFWLRAHRGVIDDLRPVANLAADVPVIRWRSDIFPFQWRIAVSWVSGYFIFQLFTPMAFATAGPVDAGRLGLSLVIFNALLTIGMSWVYAKVPQFAAHVSRHERAQLNGLFTSVVKRSMMVTCLAVAGFIVSVMVLDALGIGVLQRIAPVPVLVCLGIVTLVNSFIFSAAAYMRAHREEPMLLPSIVSGVAVLGGVSLAAPHGVLAMMSLYAAITVFVALPWTLWLFSRYFFKVPDLTRVHVKNQV